MEYLDYYDENHQYLGTESRDIIHTNGLWHNTVHCWLYDKLGNIYFQVRKDDGKLYTSASGHVSAGETIEEAFGREIKEEIGIDINYKQAKLIDTVIWKMDKIRSDGSNYSDRAFANVSVCLIDDQEYTFSFDENEVTGLVKVGVKDTLKLFKNEITEVTGELILENNQREKRDLIVNDFLVQSHEMALTKYQKILESIINEIEK